MVRTSASVWVGWNSLVRPFHTGTPAYWARISTVSWANPRYSIPSKVRPSTRAVSFMDSLCPICEPPGSRYVTSAPWSWAATSNAVRVRVEVFSKMRAMFFPERRRCSKPPYLAALRSSDSLSRKRSSSVVKSSSFRKLRLRRLNPMTNPSSCAGREGPVRRACAGDLGPDYHREASAAPTGRFSTGEGGGGSDGSVAGLLHGGAPHPGGGDDVGQPGQAGDQGGVGRHDLDDLLEGPARHVPGGLELVGQGVDADFLGPPADVAVELVEHGDPEGAEFLPPVVSPIHCLLDDARFPAHTLPPFDRNCPRNPSCHDCSVRPVLGTLPFDHFWSTTNGRYGVESAAQAIAEASS